MARVTFAITSHRASRRRIISLSSALLCCLALASGCASRRHAAQTAAYEPNSVARPHRVARPTAESQVALVAHHQSVADDSDQGSQETQRPSDVVAPELLPVDSLADLESLAQSMNPALRRLGEEVAAAQAKTNYVDKLPDPTVGANIFAYPIETAAGAQRANVTVMQMIPWLNRLDAKAQQAFFEALALEQLYEAKRLEVVGDVRALWYRLYVIGKQIETNRANHEFLKTLIAVANARVSTGKASQGDVLLGTLELSKLAEQRLTFEQQFISTKAELNRVIGRDAEHPISIPRNLQSSLPDWSHEMLRDVAWQQQPEIAAAQLRTQATCWGIEVARLKRRPDLSLSATWYAIDDNRPVPSLVDVGQDALSIGASVSVPLWHHKYDAIQQEAARKHSASNASVEEVMQRYDARLRDLWQQATTANETAELYKETLLPQGRQTLEADQESYSNDTVEFDRVVRDFRNVLMLELGYHRAIGELAAILARIEQAVGTDLTVH